MSKSIEQLMSEKFAEYGTKGGAVKGPTKRRGGKEYYRQLALKRWSKAVDKRKR